MSIFSVPSFSGDQRGRMQEARRQLNPSYPWGGGRNYHPLSENRDFSGTEPLLDLRPVRKFKFVRCGPVEKKPEHSIFLGLIVAAHCGSDPPKRCQNYHFSYLCPKIEVFGQNL